MPSSWSDAGSFEQPYGWDREGSLLVDHLDQDLADVGEPLRVRNDGRGMEDDPDRGVVGHAADSFRPKTAISSARASGVIRCSASRSFFRARARALVGDVDALLGEQGTALRPRGRPLAFHADRATRSGVVGIGRTVAAVLHPSALHASTRRPRAPNEAARNVRGKWVCVDPDGFPDVTLPPRVALLP
jgi:hypothetical protein